MIELFWRGEKKSKSIFTCQYASFIFTIKIKTILTPLGKKSDRKLIIYPVNGAEEEEI